MFETDLKSPSIIRESSFSWNRNKVSRYNDLSRPFWKRKKKHNAGFLPSVIIQGRPRAISNKSRKETALIRDCSCSPR